MWPTLSVFIDNARNVLPSTRLSLTLFLILTILQYSSANWWFDNVSHTTWWLIILKMFFVLTKHSLYFRAIIDGFFCINFAYADAGVVLFLHAQVHMYARVLECMWCKMNEAIRLQWQTCRGILNYEKSKGTRIMRLNNNIFSVWHRGNIERYHFSAIAWISLAVNNNPK